MSSKEKVEPANVIKKLRRFVDPAGRAGAASQTLRLDCKIRKSNVSASRGEKRIHEGGEAVTHRQVALIRGINVGRAKRVAMADLRTLVEELGYGDVRTLLNSGNVVFTTPRAAAGTAAARIEKALVAKLGVSARVTVLGAAELAAAITENPLAEVADDPSRLLVAVLSNPADRRKLEPLTKQDWATEALALGTRVAYLWCSEGILASRLAEAVNRALGDAVTARNWATVLKLRALTEDERG
jgi:uncharacterized protein (DUF1697 family)